MKFLIFLAAGCFMVFGQPVYSQNIDEFTLSQGIRNLTKQNFAWSNSLMADPDDRLELQVVIMWNGSQSAKNVWVRETLGQGLTYAGNLKLDGVPIQGSVIEQNINIGTIDSQKSKTITFEALVQPSEVFPIGTTSINNVATVFNTQNAKTMASMVQVTRGGNPTDVITGPLTFWMISGFLVVLSAGFAVGIFFVRFYVQHRVLKSNFESRIDRKLAVSIEEIRRRERKKG